MWSRASAMLTGWPRNRKGEPDLARSDDPRGKLPEHTRERTARPAIDDADRAIQRRGIADEPSETITEQTGDDTGEQRDEPDALNDDEDTDQRQCDEGT